MCIELLITILGAAIGIIATNIALIGWIRSDGKQFESEIRGWKDEINKEMKDFHGRLCEIEKDKK